MRRFGVRRVYSASPEVQQAMKFPVNRFKQALQDGDTQIGLWLALADGYCAEICAGAGFDWVVLDGEHGPNDLRSLLSQLQALAAYPASHPVVRVPAGDAVLIKQVLELGAQTLLVPMVETADQAAAIVRATRYPPEGIRGLGSAIARSSRWTRIADYPGTANREIGVLVQIETRPALDNLEAIAAVEGIDGLFIGPDDLAASLGYPGNPGQADMQAVIEDTVGRIRATGKPAGIIWGDEQRARRYLDLGCQFVAVGADAVLLAHAADALAARFRQA